jgi:hypothetical protein
MLSRLGLLALAAVAMNQVTLIAHDMWIEPATFLPESVETIPLRLRVGQDLLGDPLPRDSKLINQFIVEDADSRRPAVGRDGGDPAGFVLSLVPGLLVVGYQSNPSPVELTAEKFNQYLKDEGLDTIAALRAKRNESGAKARELFFRCAKSLILSGPANEAQRDRQLGFTLELVAERNPYATPPDQDIPFRLTYENRPLQGALVVAMNKMNPSQKLSARTDANGRVRFRLKPGGMWLVKAVHMIAAPAGAGNEWTSFWASITFDPPAAAAKQK